VAIPEQALRAGLATARWPGRFELLNRQPALVVDSAHNENSARKLRAALAEWFPRPPRRQLALIFGASSDKDIAGMLESFLGPEIATGYPPADKVIVSKSGHPRSADPAQLADLVRKVNPTCPISVHASLDSAFTEALAWAGPNDLICVTGSIFVVAQARRAWAAPSTGPTGRAGDFTGPCRHCWDGRAGYAGFCRTTTFCLPSSST